MLKKIQALLKKATRQPSIDASSFNDALALEIHWAPLKGGGSNFRTHKLVPVDYNRMEFKATLGAKIFCFIFMVVGLAVPAGSAVYKIQQGESFPNADFLYLLLFGLIFFGVGSFMFYNFAKPVIFDKLTGMYWKGWKAPKSYLPQYSGKNGSRISNIYAVQILAEFVRSDKSSYYSYELNLVLKDGSRMNVIDHGNPIKIREDAKILSEFLCVPVWDAINA